MRWQIAIFTLMVVQFGCKNPFKDAPPVDVGQTLSFTVVEAQGDLQRSYVLRARVRDPGQGTELHMETPKGTLIVPVDESLVPIDPENVPIEFPLALTSSTARPGHLWLPTANRVDGAKWDGHENRGIISHQRWKTWSVVGPDGMPRYYEIETGLLVDFRLLVDEVRVTGTLVSAQ